MNNKTNLFRGSNIESLFKNSLSRQPEAVQAIKQALDVNIDGEIAKAYKTGMDAGKADVMVRFTTGETLGANIKSYKGDTTGFNQAMRMSPYNFTKTFNLSETSRLFLRDSILDKAKDKNQPFILPTRPMFDHFLTEITTKAVDIIRYSICGKESPELFVLWKDSDSKMMIYLMQSVLTQMSDLLNVVVTKRGVIRFNPYFTMQRKGGNGVHDKHQKTDIKHGGNNVQIKINTAKFGNEIEPLCYYIA